MVSLECGGQYPPHMLFSAVLRPKPWKCGWGSRVGLVQLACSSGLHCPDRDGCSRLLFILSDRFVDILWAGYRLGSGSRVEEGIFISVIIIRDFSWSHSGCLYLLWGLKFCRKQASVWDFSEGFHPLSTSILKAIIIFGLILSALI